MTHDGGTQPLMHISVQSGTFAAREAWEQILAGLRPLALSEDDISRTQLVITEVLNNVVEHAYEDQQDAGPIDLSCTQEGDLLRFLVSDSGKAMPEGQAPEGKAHDLNVDMMDLPEGGFGWFMIRDLAEEVRYCRAGSENQLSLNIRLSKT